MVLIDKTMLEVSNGLRYVPVAKALKEHRPNQSEATFNLQWQRLFRVFLLCLIKKDPDKETTIYYSSSSNIRGFVILALAPRIFVLLVKSLFLKHSVAIALHSHKAERHFPQHQ